MQARIGYTRSVEVFALYPEQCCIAAFQRVEPIDECLSLRS
jgi:hypothetical protein